MPWTAVLRRLTRLVSTVRLAGPSWSPLSAHLTAPWPLTRRLLLVTVGRRRWMGGRLVCPAWVSRVKRVAASLTEGNAHSIMRQRFIPLMHRLSLTIGHLSAWNAHPHSLRAKLCRWWTTLVRKLSMKASSTASRPDTVPVTPASL